MNNFSRNKTNLHGFFDNQSSRKEAMDLLFGKDDISDDNQRQDQLFPDLKKRAAKERAKEIVSNLEEMILNPERLDGKTGTDYRSWAKAARKEISEAIQEAETGAAFRELISANRIGGLCVKIGFLLLATVASFAAFWYGILFIWTEHGPIWGFGATLSAVGLSVAFTTAGLVLGTDRREQAEKIATEKYEAKNRKFR